MPGAWHLYGRGQRGAAATTAKNTKRVKDRVMNFFKTSYHSPVGTLQVVCSNDALAALTFLKEGEAGENTAGNSLTEQTCEQLDEYFGGKRKIFQIPMQQNGTAFQAKVWHLLQTIPYGKTVSYMDLSKN